MSIFASKYQLIRIWGQELGSFDYFIENEQAKAESDNAPLEAIYQRDGQWMTIHDVNNKDVRRTVLGKLLEYYAYHETADKREAWEKAKPKVIVIDRQRPAQIEIAKQFVNQHRYSVDAWTAKIERPTTSDDEAYHKIYFSLIGGEYGEVTCIDDGEYEIEIGSSDSYSGHPVLFTFQI